MAEDLSAANLRDIRDGIQALRSDTNVRLQPLRGGCSQRRAQTNARLDQTNSRLERVEHGLNDVARSMRQIALDRARHERVHAHHVERMEDDVIDLKGRVQRSEERAGR